MKKVAILMGSKSDFEIVLPAKKVLEQFNIPVTVRVLSAHRTPDEAHEFSKNARENGYGVIIAAAGKAAHLAGVLAAGTTLPVIALPVKTSFMGGLDSVLSMLPMPSGIPVATVGVNSADNAALLAVQILSIFDERLKTGMDAYREQMRQKVLSDDQEINSLL